LYPYVRHLGIYGFKTAVLEQLVALPPSALELTESLEQLRWLENGYSIQVDLVDAAGPGIDTPDDLKTAEAWLATHG
jgi:3-deoxy-manno-octulosonate cytidylyltransferase (CMP-KDO synthetase)